MARADRTDLPDGKAEYFSQWGWTGNSLICPSGRSEKRTHQFCPANHRTSKSSSSVTFSKSVTSASICMCQRPGKRQRHAAHMPVAVGPERRLALDRLDAALRQAQRQRRLLGQQAGWHRPPSIAARNRRTPLCPARSAPGTSPFRCGYEPPAAPPCRSQRARRRRETPAGDDGQNADDQHAFQHDRSQQWPRVLVIRAARA